MTIPADILAHLKSFDTPTIWNALNGLRGRKLDGFTRGAPVVTHPAAPPIVGYALTAKLVASAPSKLPSDQGQALRRAYYEALDVGPRPAVVVIEDCGETAGIGAFWGEVNSAIHRGFGISGVITNGAVRDLDALDPALPILAGTICLSNAFAHLTEIACPVEVFGLRVHPGDLIHADRHGAMTIPAEHIAALPDAIARLIEREHRVIAATREPGFNADAMMRAWAAMGAGH